MKIVAQEILKEEKQKEKANEQAARARKEGERPKMKVTTTNHVIGWSRDGKIRFGWGYECWQWRHKARRIFIYK